MKEKKEIIHQLNTAKSHKTWELTLAAMEARNSIPEVLLDSPERLCQLAEIYVMAAIQGPCYDWYMYMAGYALDTAQRLAGCRTSVMVLRGRAFKAHMEYILYGPVERKALPVTGRTN